MIPDALIFVATLAGISAAAAKQHSRRLRLGLIASGGSLIAALVMIGVTRPLWALFEPAGMLILLIAGIFIGKKLTKVKPEPDNDEQNPEPEQAPQPAPATPTRVPTVRTGSRVNRASSGTLHPSTGGGHP